MYVCRRSTAPIVAQKILKLLLVLTGIIAAGLLGFIGLIMLSFGGASVVSMGVCVAFTILIVAYIFLKSYDLLSPSSIKARRWIIAAGVLAIGIDQGYKYYVNQLTVIDDQALMLEDYQPFKAQTKAINLHEPSTLKLTTELPRMDGATALYPLYSAFAMAVYPNKEYNKDTSEVQCDNTIHAYEQLVDDRADVIFVAGPSEQQLDYARKKGIELQLHPIGKEAFVFFVNKNNKVDALSLDQIRNIYSGLILNWQDLGGSWREIKAFQRPEGSGSQTMLVKIMKNKKLAIPPKDEIIGGMGGIIEETASYRNFGNAIGYSFLFYATQMVKNNEIKVLKVNGVYPDKASVRDGSYPLSAQFYAVTKAKPPAQVTKLINWIKGPQGQYLVEKTGYVPLNH